ncbi:MAG: PLP-dependent aminotransferase family protein [Deltaproteobacteria bacterium]|nr:PLP-dependent aminotransferase family protein [Deltaproteobacteria bacterium]
MSDRPEGLRDIPVPEYWRYEPPAVTRRMASMLAELEAAGSADEVAHLGPGYPSPAVSYPLEDDAHYAAWLEFETNRREMTLSKYLSSLRAYGPTEGWPDFRKNFARVYGNDFGGQMEPEALIPTTGATGGIDLMATAVAQYGEPVAVITDSPTYAGVTARLQRDRNTRIYSVEMDEEGPIPHMFAEAIDRARRDGRFVAFYYTIPDGHNPAGMSFSRERRDEIYRICREKDILLVEDAPYTYISFEPEGRRPKPFFANDPDGRVIHLFTASKIWEPGMRVGYAHVPSHMMTADRRSLSLRRILLSIGGSAYLFLNPTPYAVFNSILHRKKGDDSFELSTLWDRARRKVEIYGENRSILLKGLEHYFGGHRDMIDWTVPGAGFFVVVRFKGAPFITDMDFVADLLQQDKVTAIPTNDFFPPDAKERNPAVSHGALRLSFSFTRSDDPDLRRAEIERAVNRFGPAILRRLGRGVPPPMAPTFGPAGSADGSTSVSTFALGAASAVLTVPSLTVPLALPAPSVGCLPLPMPV